MSKNIRDLILLIAANLMIPALMGIVLLGFALRMPWLKMLGAGLLLAYFVATSFFACLLSFKLGVNLLRDRHEAP